MEIIERGALCFHNGIELGLQFQFARNVLEQKQKAAHRVALAGHRQGPLIR